VATSVRDRRAGGELWVNWCEGAVLVLLVGHLTDDDAIRLKRRLTALVDRDVEEVVVDCAGVRWLSDAVLHALADVAVAVRTGGGPGAELVVTDPPHELGVRLRDRGIATSATRLGVPV
jgi:anti-anti-sigma regulatory factor